MEYVFGALYLLNAVREGGNVCCFTECCQRELTKQQIIRGGQNSICCLCVNLSGTSHETRDVCFSQNALLPVRCPARGPIYIIEFSVRTCFLSVKFFSSSRELSFLVSFGISIMSPLRCIIIFAYKLSSSSLHPLCE